jgi:hypothetical protein
MVGSEGVFKPWESIRFRVSAEVSHVILVGCLVEEDINPFEGSADSSLIRDTSAQEFRPRGKPFRRPWG